MIRRFNLIAVLCLVSTSLFAGPKKDEDREFVFLVEQPYESRTTLVASKEFLEHDPSQRQVLIIANLQEDYEFLALVGVLLDSYSYAQPKQNSLESVRTALIETFWDVSENRWPPELKTPYYSGEDLGSKHVWRTLGWLAPDLIIVLTRGKNYSIGIPESLPKPLVDVIKKTGIANHTLPITHLASAVTSANPPPAGVGTIPAIEVMYPESSRKFRRGFLDRLESANRLLGQVRLLKLLHEANLPEISPAHQELLNRRQRTPLEIAKQLDAVYGHDLKKVMYQPALSLVARLNLDDLIEEKSRYADVEQIVSAYASGDTPSLGNRPSGSVTAGHLIFSELAHRVDKGKYRPLVLKAADQAFDEKGSPLEAMPAHSEMSDSVFMGTPILAAAGRLTGDEKYYEMCLQHVRFMQRAIVCARMGSIGILRSTKPPGVAVTVSLPSVSRGHFRKSLQIIPSTKNCLKIFASI